MQAISEEHLNKYRAITTEALQAAKQAPINDQAGAEQIFDMVERYLQDAQYFREKDDWPRCLAAISYAHGWLDCGARLKTYTVTDNRLFTEDGED